MKRLHATSVLALGFGIASAMPAFAQEVRGSESPATTANAPSPASTATPAAPGAPSAAPAEQGLGEIVVTARKVAENMQKVPVAITAFSGAELQQQGAAVVADVAKLTPGLIITQASSTQTAATFTIRGQVQQDDLATLDPSVGVYVDGFYWARAYGLNADLLDIQDFQTLKGPQGTLFGRNTTGGAILIQTNDPNFRDGISVLASGTYGRFNQWSGTGILNLPIIDDKLAVRLAYERNTRDGYATEPNTGQKMDSRNEYTARAKLLYKPTDNLSILLSAEQYRAKFLANPYRSGYVSTTSAGNIEAGAEATGGACLAGGAAVCAGQGIPLTQQSIAAAGKGDTVAQNQLPETFAKTQTYTATVTLDTFFGALKAIGGYRKVRASATLDLDGSPYNLLSTTGQQDLSQYSVEFQATGKAFDNKLDFAAGVFYFHESGIDLSYSTALPFLSPQVSYLAGDIDNDSQGLYGQGTYHLTDKLSFTGGLRYSVDDKRIIADNGNYTGGVGGGGGTVYGPGPGAVFTCTLDQCPQPRHASFSGVSYTAGLDYQVSPDLLVYVKTAKGFRSGGQNLRGINVPTAPVFEKSTSPFGPEKATSYEGGVKTEFFDHKLRINAAGYYTIDKGIQRTSLLSAIIPGTTTFETATVVTNAGRADIYGAELEAQALLPFGFRVDSSLAYTHPKYVSYINPFSGFDQSHERFYGIAKWTASISPSWTQDLGFGKFLLRGDFSYQSKTALYNNGYYTTSDGVIHDASTGDPVTAADRAGYLSTTTDRAHLLVNARASLTLLEDKLDVAVWGKNLSDRRDKVVGLPITALGEASYIRREPRTVGVTVTLKFKNL